jgi:hypothetical protein
MSVVGEMRSLIASIDASKNYISQDSFEQPKKLNKALHSHSLHASKHDRLQHAN